MDEVEQILMNAKIEPLIHPPVDYTCLFVMIPFGVIALALFLIIVGAIK